MEKEFRLIPIGNIRLHPLQFFNYPYIYFHKHSTEDFPQPQVVQGLPNCWMHIVFAGRRKMIKEEENN